MEIKKGDIVRSEYGRDKQRYFYVVEAEGEFLRIADGMVRKIDDPKKKKLKHVVFVARPDTRVREKLVSDERLYDAEIRKSLRQLGFCEDYDGYGKAEDN